MIPHLVLVTKTAGFCFQSILNLQKPKLVLASKTSQALTMTFDAYIISLRDKRLVNFSTPP